MALTILTQVHWNRNCKNVSEITLNNIQKGQPRQQ